MYYFFATDTTTNCTASSHTTAISASTATATATATIATATAAAAIATTATIVCYYCSNYTKKLPTNILLLQHQQLEHIQVGSLEVELLPHISPQCMCGYLLGPSIETQRGRGSECLPNSRKRRKLFAAIDARGVLMLYQHFGALEGAHMAVPLKVTVLTSIVIVIIHVQRKADRSCYLSVLRVGLATALVTVYACNRLCSLLKLYMRVTDYATLTFCAGSRSVQQYTCMLRSALQYVLLMTYMNAVRSKYVSYNSYAHDFNHKMQPCVSSLCSLPLHLIVLCYHTAPLQCVHMQHYIYMHVCTSGSKTADKST
jgi:hypothetical protein